jgi:hypothetical protein
MNRLTVIVLAAALWIGAALPAGAQNESKAIAATPQNAAAFVGEWTISAKGSYGDFAATVVLKVTGGKIEGDITDTNGRHPLGDVSKSGESLIAYYAFDYNGMPIDVVVTLTPNDKDKRTDAYLDFANGAAQFTGTAVKK